MRWKTLLTGLVVAAASLTLATGCRKGDTADADDHANHDHSHDDGHHHDDGDDDGHGHGALIQLGETTIGAFTVTATRDEGQIEAGGEAAVDVTVTPGAEAAGDGAKVAAVRFWIGTEDAKGSVKARAEIEDPDEPNRWHTHVEIPSPLPDGSKLWVEVEDKAGGRSVGGFDMKA